MKTKKTKKPAPKATKSKPSAFDHLVAAAMALYEEEMERLADELRPRILAGEFSDASGRDGAPGWMVLMRHLEETHPWMTTQRKQLVTTAASRWLDREEKALTDPADGKVLSGGISCEAGLDALECMAHDVLAVAAARGWVKRMGYINAPGTYALRVA